MWIKPKARSNCNGNNNESLDSRRGDTVKYRQLDHWTTGESGTCSKLACCRHLPKRCYSQPSTTLMVGKGVRVRLRVPEPNKKSSVNRIVLAYPPNLGLGPIRVRIRLENRRHCRAQLRRRRPAHPVPRPSLRASSHDQRSRRSGFVICIWSHLLSYYPATWDALQKHTECFKVLSISHHT
ncbi:hypothetical protein L210DRAFT_363845 [Boletus edulis BED1]|uniref:Uncharacterized protein n=1 Tax=Boletus edulis BED1 TaxID=1328754 RepID=A0AAD4BNG5_BOLED|nr:hypothetical protein L210DRAFT_363845 [Boletus edulis BED1]